MKNKNQRHQEALVRKAEYDKLTAAQKLIKLDIKLGGGKGAMTERARLGLEILKEKTEPKKSVQVELNVPKKNYQKPKKS